MPDWWDLQFAGLALSKGTIYGHKVVNKFGRAPSGIQSTMTDVWDRADATPTQSIWLAPTTGRQHIIISSSDADSGGGTGMRTIRVFGLQNWNDRESSEEVTLLGTASSVVTGSSYVIIHRMRGVTFGSSNSANLGTIQALAQADSTVTAQINAKEGQTQMAIYGVPRAQTAYVTSYYGTLNKSQGAASTVNFSFVVNPEPEEQTTSFIIKNTRGLQSTGNSADTWNWHLPYKVSGPAILKVEGQANTNDIEASAGFEVVLVDN